VSQDETQITTAAADTQPTTATTEDQAAEAALPLYDAGATQRIPFLIETDDGLAEVFFHLGPQTDEALIEHERQRNLRLVKADIAETGGVHGVEAKTRKVEANALLFDEVAVGAGGFGDSDVLPEGWKDFIEKKDKSDVIEQAYLAVEMVKPQVAQIQARVPWNYRSRTKTHTLRALFEGQQLDLKHTLNSASASQLDEFNSVMSQSYLVQGAMVMQGETLIPPRLKRLGKLYQQLHVSHEGYAGFPPLHHQAEAVMAHLGSVLEALKKKPSESQTPSS
jgi:hypothetical protein